MKINSFYILTFFAFPFSSVFSQDTVKVSTLAGLDFPAEKLYNSGIAKFANKDYNGAMTDFNQALILNQNFEKAYYNRGIVKFELKDVNGAIDDYNQSIKLHDSCAECYFSRAQAKYLIGSKTDASTDYTKSFNSIQTIRRRIITEEEFYLKFRNTKAP